jgi:hypothetical protein
LRIAVIASDPVRRAGLVAIVTGAGHEIVDTVDRADVVLADAVDVEAGGAAVVALGSADLGQAGILPRDASPAQINAAATICEVDRARKRAASFKSGSDLGLPSNRRFIDAALMRPLDPNRAM